MQRSLRRIKHRIKRLVTSYVSPLGWAVTGLAIASLIAFTILSWHELLTMAIVFACMMVAAIMLSLGNTSFTATIDVSSRRVTVSDTVKVDVCVDNPGRTPTTSARGDLPIGDSHERFAIPMLAAGQSRQTTVEFTAVSRAVLPVGPLSIRKGDPFGLVRHEKKLVDQINVFIHPKTVMLNTLNAGIPRDLEGQPSGEIVDDDLDFYGLREYEPGDDVRNVHWLSSAKTGALMIDPSIRGDPTHRHRIDHQREPRRLCELRRIRTGGIRPCLHRRAMPAPKPTGDLTRGNRTHHATQLHGIP